jgi:hypothetical protein
MPEIVNPATQHRCGSADAELMRQGELTAVSEFHLLAQDL